MRAPIRPAVGGLFVVSLVLAAGCGGAVGQPTGKVTFRGEPVAGAALTFQPVSNPDAVATGVTGADGQYRLDYGGKGGVPVGKCTVRVVRWTLPNGKTLPPGEAGAALKSDETKAVQTAYVFERDVAAGAGTIDFELTEGKKE